MSIYSIKNNTFAFMKILTVIGARPQFIKASTISNKLRNSGINEVLIHTGQHYDSNMSDIFFEELNIPKPDYNLGIKASSHGSQTGQMLIELEKVYLDEKPDLVIVYGDTNSTLAGALCASKLLIPIVHIEAGLRSFNKAMPEEQNRIITDHLSKYLFAPTQTAVQNLHNENIYSGVFNVGDVMFDAILNFKEQAKKHSHVVDSLNSPDYILATIHRAENTNNRNRLFSIFKALNDCGKNIVLPMHPRTSKYLAEFGISVGSNIQILPPQGYLDMISLQDNAQIIITDSGGIQKEAYFLHKPCVTLRDETEWIETLENDWNTLAGYDYYRIINAINNATPKGVQSAPFGNGNASDIIVKQITTQNL